MNIEAPNTSNTVVELDGCSMESNTAGKGREDQEGGALYLTVCDDIAALISGTSVALIDCMIANNTG